MRRFYFMMVLALLLQACSGLNPPAPTATATSTVTRTSTPAPTSTVTRVPSITPTATIVRIPTWDAFQPTATLGIIPVFVNGNLVTPDSTLSALSLGVGFDSILVSEKKIFWGSCKHNRTTITAKVKNPDDVYSVVIFVRVKELTKEDYTPWTTGDVLQAHRDGTYTYTLVGSNIEGHNHYKASWVFFQLVATNEMGEAIGRSAIFTNSISLSPCM